MTVTQSQFVGALLDSELPVPDGLTDPQGRPDAKRFAVYRNNVAVSLTQALELAFPVIRKLVGDEFFAAMAGVFLRRHPPTTALMMFYGAEMPEFLRHFEPVQHLQYLPDVARLELALRQSYHAGDSDPIDPAILQSIAPDQLMAAQLNLAPSAIMVSSDWPIYGIWQFNTQDHVPPPQMAAQSVLITRPEFDPQPHLLPAGGDAFMQSIIQGEKLAAAIAQAGSEFDLTETLNILLAGRAIIKIETEG